MLEKKLAREMALEEKAAAKRIALAEKGAKAEADARSKRVSGAIRGLGSWAIRGAGVLAAAGAGITGLAIRESLQLDERARRVAIQGSTLTHREDPTGLRRHSNMGAAASAVMSRQAKNQKQSRAISPLMSAFAEAVKDGKDGFAAMRDKLAEATDTPLRDLGLDLGEDSPTLAKIRKFAGTVHTARGEGSGITADERARAADTLNRGSAAADKSAAEQQAQAAKAHQQAAQQLKDAAEALKKAVPRSHFAGADAQG